MKIHILTFFLCMHMTGDGQESKGIKFENSRNWNEVLAKAKKENKFIFLDGYTTWCAPCRKMAADVFSLDSVGKFFNDNFINVAVQFDSAKNDNPHVKGWYKDAKAILKDQKIAEYPTYLFFSPAGDLVHKLVGATYDPQEFIAKSKNALSPKTQYISLKKQFENGRHDTLFLLALIQLAEKANDNANKPKYYNQFLATQPNLLTPRNINFIAKGTANSTDIGYNILKNNPKEVEAVIGMKERLQILQNISFDEDVLPAIRIDGKKQNLGGGMVIYSGKLADSVDWNKVNATITDKYGKNLAAQILALGKMRYYTWAENWSGYNNTLTQYLENKDFDIELVDKEAWNFTTYCSNVKDLEEALGWASILDNDRYNNVYEETYSRLLYKAGKKEKAIVAMKKYRSSLSKPNTAVDEAIKQMENGEYKP